MTEFNFPDNCSYCSRIQGKPIDCSLPYSLVKNSKLSTDMVTRMMEVMDLHNKYGIDPIKFINSYVESSINSQSEEQSLTDIEETQSETRHSLTSQQIDTKSDEIKKWSEQADKDLIIETNFPILPESEKPIISKETGTEISKKDEPYLKGKLTAEGPSNKGKGKMITSIVTNDPGLKSEPVQYSVEGLQHIIDDVVLAITAGYNLHKKKTEGKRVLLLLKAMTQEVNWKCHSGRTYQPKQVGTLDHEIGIARALVKGHHSDVLLEWEKGNIKASKTDFCLLNFGPFNNNSANAARNHLIDSLCAYARSSLSSSNMDIKQRQIIVKLVEGELEDQELTQAYKWFQTFKPNIINDGKTRDISESSSKKKIKTFQDESSDDEEHKCPAIEEETQQIIDRRLLTTVKQAMKSNSWKGFTPPIPLSQEEALMKISAEVLKHNKSWKNPDFIVTKKNLRQAMRWSKVTSTTDEESFLHWTIIAIVTTLRQEKP